MILHSFHPLSLALLRPFGARAATEGRPYTEGRGDRRFRGELRLVMITTSPRSSLSAPLGRGRAHGPPLQEEERR